MEAVYEWIRQIAVFAVISFLILYLMGNQEKKHILRFYLSLLMLFLILKPAAAFLNLNQVLTEKLTELETDAEMAVMSGQIRQAAAAFDQEILDDASQKALSWIRELVQEENLELLEGEIFFDEETLEAGEVVISKVRITVSGSADSSGEIQPVPDDLKSEIAKAFELNKNSVSVIVKAGAQKDES